MSLYTQDEVNKAARSRSLSLIDDVVIRVRLELFAKEEQREEAKSNGHKITATQRYEIQLIKLNIERLEKRIAELGKRTYLANKKREEDKAKLEMFVAIAKARMPISGNINQVVIPNASTPTYDKQGQLATGDKQADEALNSIRNKMLAGKDLETIAEEAKQKPTFSFHDLFQENTDGTVDL